MAKKVPMDKLQPFCRDISEFILEEYKGGAKFRNDDTIMARITPCLENGKISKVSVLDDDEVGFGSTEYIVFRAIEGISDADFLYYLICSPLVRNPAIKSMVGSSGRQRVQTDVVADLDIELPHIEEQRKIGSILRSLDDKIALNNAINNNLEQQAMALFKSWFIDYEPYNRTVPNNWVEYKLSDFLPVITGKKNANVSSSIGTYPFFSCSQDITWTDEYSFEGNAILVAGNGDFNVKFYNGKFEAYQRTYVLIPHNPRFSAWLFYAVKYNLNKITAAARGSVIKFITKGNLEGFSFYAPLNLDDFDVIDQFTAINNIIASNREESTCLSDLRDTLLPKLMSGELDVSNIDL
ncbi:hypothetical protein HMPREF9629_01490 [Peptoanaerobacter stomatis]|uniref:Type I restriction modification DNA specificity domain-containing protein n=1 Tax=Peptoanaerobacter stomatis TaxID=796937 RepID=G9WZ89_9FIRM|nr:restriction endonuclease subunit S [Peptoanaerobacter stomatis]EHL16065.1 hypothetical protein HMPREF9629_01490 [Peptoanaerobacter stomatis]